MMRRCLSLPSRVSGRRGLASKVGVIGLGLMGHGIAQVSAEKGFQVRSPHDLPPPRFRSREIARGADRGEMVWARRASCASRVVERVLYGWVGELVGGRGSSHCMCVKRVMGLLVLPA